MKLDRPGTVLAFRSVTKLYGSGSERERAALSGLSFELSPGRQVAVVGRSGSGKSTLLHLAAGIDLPTSGEIWVGGKELGRMSDRERTLLRRREVGLIFQFFYLLPHLSVRDNVALPHWIAGIGGSELDRRILQLLERVGLEDRSEDNIQQLSGGEMQRVAVCRALLQKPRLLLADEPTGNLDDENSARVMNLMLAMAAEEESTLIYVTHSRELAALAQETWILHSGVLERP